MARPEMRCSALALFVVLIQPVQGQVPAPAPVPSVEESRPEFSSFLNTLKEQALAAGVSGAVVERSLSGLEPLEIVVERDRSQPEIVLTTDQYVQRRLTRAFVRTATEKTREHQATVSEIAKKYGMDRRVIVAIWGMESNFGRFTGTRPIIQALATLAWEGRRRAFFTGELINALQILDQGLIEADQMKGSWAGAMGQTQFMPSSYLAHAQDYDGDGRRDIWKTLPDVFASIANYMVAYRMEGRPDMGPRGEGSGRRRHQARRVSRLPPERLPCGARDDRADSPRQVAVPGRQDGHRRRPAEGQQGRVAVARRLEELPGLR